MDSPDEIHEEMTESVNASWGITLLKSTRMRAETRLSVISVVALVRASWAADVVLAYSESRTQWNVLFSQEVRLKVDCRQVQYHRNRLTTRQLRRQ